MANYQIEFFDTDDDGSVSCWVNGKNEITISTHCNIMNNTILISLDKSTAIKFAKTLRTEINLIQEEVQHV